MRAVTSIAALLIIGFSSLDAEIGPTLNVSDLIQTSDLVVVGTVSGTLDIGADVVAVGPRELPVRLRTAALDVDQYLKGSDNAGQIVFQYFAPDMTSRANSVPVDSPGDQRRVYFLSRHGSVLRATNPYHLSIAVGSGPVPQGLDVEERVGRAVGLIVRSATSTFTEKADAVNTLSKFASAVGTSELRVVLRDPDNSLRAGAAGVLLAKGDMAGLAVAEAVLLGEVSGVRSSVLPGLRTAVSSLQDDKSTSTLARLLGAEAVETRRAAATALRHMASPEAAPALVRALEDRDAEVQFLAATGLAVMSGQDGHVLSRELFDSRRPAEVTYWKTWALDRGHVR